MISLQKAECFIINEQTERLQIRRTRQDDYITNNFQGMTSRSVSQLDSGDSHYAFAAGIPSGNYCSDM